MRIAEPSFSADQHLFVKDFLNRPGNRYVYGRTQEAASLASLVDVDGFIDDFSKDRSFLGKPCMPLAEVPKGSRIVSAVVQAFPNSVYRKLEATEHPFIDYFAFRAISGLPLVEIPYWAGAKEHYDKNSALYVALYNRLADDESKMTFENVLNFRLNYDFSEMRRFTANLKGMYFENFLGLPTAGCVFFDVGAYDGYNTEHFARLYPSFGKVVLFEPIPAQADLLASKFSRDNRIKVQRIALSDQDGLSTFNLNSTASRLTQSGEGITVRTARLDTYCRDSGDIPNFMKMDIEGAEILALSGAANTIRAHKPALAISVYHRASHMIDAFQLIQELNSSYRFFLRHYTEGYTETVLFAIPE